MAEYRLTPAAEADLEAIWTYTAHQWGLDQANRYFDIITAAFSQLADRPETARLRRDPPRLPTLQRGEPHDLFSNHRLWNRDHQSLA